MILFDLNVHYNVASMFVTVCTEDELQTAIATAAVNSCHHCYNRLVQEVLTSDIFVN